MAIATYSGLRASTEAGTARSIAQPPAVSAMRAALPPAPLGLMCRVAPRPRPAPPASPGCDLTNRGATAPARLRGFRTRPELRPISRSVLPDAVARGHGRGGDR